MHTKKLLIFIVTAFMLSACTTSKPIASNGEEDLTRYVNPNIGTAHSRWFFYTPAAVPFGMAKLAPSTNGSYGNKSGWEAVGYEDIHNSIEGFACFHEFQIGGVMLMPVVGEPKTQPGKLDAPQSGYRSGFDKKDEFGTAGYYSVLLKDYNVKAELTATERVGFQRYTFPQSNQSHIIFDIGNQLGESGKVKDASIELINETTIQGYVITEPEYVKKYQAGADVRMYFYAKLDKPITGSKIFYRGQSLKEGKNIKGVGSCLALQFNTVANEQITVKIGLSYTSVANARLNLETEAATMSFDEAKRNAHKIWNQQLGKIKVSGGLKEDRIKFYTGLYHALLGRGLASDVNGAYPENDGGIDFIARGANGKPLHNHYNTDAIWGAFWNLTQLWALAYPEYYSDWVQSQLLVYKETGWLSDGIANSKYVSGVGTNFTSLAIAAAYNCGIRDFDVPLAYEASLKNEIDGNNRLRGAGKSDVAFFVKNGFAPYMPELEGKTSSENYMFGASHTLEYSFSSFAVAQMAKLLGKQKDYELLNKLSKGWELLFDKETQYIRPRLKDGSFIKNFNPMAPWIGFQEGNALQYTFYVPHEPERLVSLVGQQQFNNRLDSIFIRSQKDIFGGGKTLNAFSGLETVYNHGNQPCLHESWLFNFSGRPDLTQKWVRAICNEFYGTDGVHGYGYGQDEDQGQLGAWYVMSAMGLFDVKGLTEINPSFQMGSPLFDKIEIQLSPKYYSGKKFVIEAKNTSHQNQFIQSAKINDQQMSGVMLPFDKLVKGGTLTLQMGDKAISR